MADEPTASELYRLVGSLRSDIVDLRAAVAALPTAALVEAREQRIADRVSAAERDIGRALAGIESLTRALEAEKDARLAADDDEREALNLAIKAEKERTTSWVKLLAGGVLAAMMTGLSKVLGWSG